MAELKVAKLTSLRRSPRLLLCLIESPKTPKPISKNLNFLSPLITPSKLRSRSPNSRKSSMGMKKSDNGSSNCEKSANGSRRTTRLSGGIVVGIVALRRSPRFHNNNKVSSSVGGFDGSIHFNAKSNRKSKKELILGGKLDIVESPVTPNGGGEKKSVGVMGKYYDTETRTSCGGISVNLERRITRSCSRLMGRMVDAGKIAEDQQNDSNSFKHCSSDVEKRAILSSVQPLAVRLDDEGRLISCCKGKKSRRNSKTVSSGSCSLSVTRQGPHGRQNNLTGYHEKNGKIDDSCKLIVGNTDRRITRSVSKSVGGENDLPSQTMVRQSTRLSSKHEAGKKGAIEAKIEKQESHMKKLEGKKKAPRHIVVKEKESHDCVELDIGKLERGSCDALPLCHISGRGDRKIQDISRDNKVTGVKRKRKQVGLQGTDQGWTREQEMALHRAYFAAKPSPHFWKEVAKLVPGKSAQECFDKVHSDNQTPICSKLSSRAKKQNSSPSLSDFLVSGSELFKSAESKRKKSCKTKSQMARKTVRHLLHKYCHVNQDNEADLFSVLEPSADEAAFQLTPKQLLQSPESSSKSCDRSSTGHKNRFSRFSGKSESPLTSPPVLKKVKNMALHEKYIDQLHVRDCKRKVAFSRRKKSAQKRKDEEKNSANIMKDMIRAAKEALVSDAKIVIDKFRHSQANIMEALSDSEEFLNSEDDDDVGTVL